MTIKRFHKYPLIAALVIFSLAAPRLDAGQELAAFFDPEKTISMDFKGVDLKDVLKLFSLHSGLNFIASENVRDKNVTLYLDNVPVREAIDNLFKANNLTYELDKESKIVIVKDWGRPRVDTVTRTFYLRYASVSISAIKKMSKEVGASGESGITDTVRKLLSENGSIIEDARTNSLIVTDIPSKMPVIAQAIAGLDVPVPQIMIEVEMLDVSKNTVDKMGIKWPQTPFTFSVTGASISSGFPFTNWLRTYFADTAKGTAGINTSAVNFILEFLRTQTDTKYLARPRILTLNNEPAEIKITTNETVGVTKQSGSSQSTVFTAEGSPERVETGVMLKVTPQVNLETGEITMYIFPSVKDTSTSSYLVSGSSSQYFKDPEERSVKSIVRVKDGETIIIGGLIRKEKTDVITKVPIMGDLPFIGAAFRHRDNSKDKERELLVFITPHIVKDAAPEIAKAKQPPALPEREQGTVSAIDRQAVVAQSLTALERKR
jgi:type II secretory pathway component GspD/PulD (secretin)